MAGKIKKKSKNEFDLPAPVITEANRAALEESGEHSKPLSGWPASAVTLQKVGFGALTCLIVHRSC